MLRPRTGAPPGQCAEAPLLALARFAGQAGSLSYSKSWLNHRNPQWDFGGELLPTGGDAQGAVGERTDSAGKAAVREVGRAGVGQRGDHQFSGARLGAHLFFAQGCCGAVELRLVSHGTDVEARSLLEDGQKVLAQGDLTVYEARSGPCQMIVRAVELQGIGALQIAFEKLEAKAGCCRVVCPRTEAAAAALSPADRLGDLADGRGDSRCAACGGAPQSGTGDYRGSLPRAGRGARRERLRRRSAS